MTLLAKAAPAPAAGCPDAGFSLIEALASLVIVSMIALMLTEGLGVGQRVWERIDTREAHGEAIDGAESLLRDRIEQTYPTTTRDISPESVDFHGGPDRLVFVANPPEANRPAPLRRYSLAVDTAGELVLSSVSDIDPKVRSQASAHVLLTGARALDLAYFGAADPDHTRRWRASWDKQPEPPELVRIRVVFEPGDTRQWPDLIVRPRVTMDTACTLDSSSHHCRGRV